MALISSDQAGKQCAYQCAPHTLATPNSTIMGNYMGNNQMTAGFVFAYLLKGTHRMHRHGHAQTRSTRGVQNCTGRQAIDQPKSHHFNYKHHLLISQPAVMQEPQQQQLAS
jgi:hypothetical protein